MTTATPVLTPVQAPASSIAHPCLPSILRRLGVNLLVACVIPAALFYTVLQTRGITTAIVAAMVWGYGAIAFRRVTRRPVSGLLVLTVSVLTIRSVFTLSTGDTFVYFLQPLVTDAGMSALFLVSLLSARPVVARLAGDFYPMSLEVASHPGVRALFFRLTLMWGCVCLVRSIAGFWMLESLSTANFVLVKEVSYTTLTLLAVTVTVVSAIAVLRRHSMLAA